MIEPVAYINVEKRQLEWAKHMAWNTPTVVKLDKIPLYTHPMRDLTDEEIAEIAGKVFYHWYRMDDMIDYAREIIKASRGEK